MSRDPNWGGNEPRGYWGGEGAKSISGRRKGKHRVPNKGTAGAHEDQQAWGEQGKKCWVRQDRWMRKELGSQWPNNAVIYWLAGP